MFELVDSFSQNAVIKVIGVGDAGGIAVQHMVNANIEGVDFICANTDAQALKNLNAKTALQFGNNITKGLGAGANPELGRQAAMEDRDRIREVIDGADMLFVTAGMGGGTGTGAAPVVAQIAREMGILTVAVITKPFPFEGRRRMSAAKAGIEELGKHVDSLITIPNEKLLSVLGKGVTLLDAFNASNEAISRTVQGISELITRPGLINVDFADVRTVMSEMGMAMMGTGTGSGDGRAHTAAQAAISSPFLEDVNIASAKGILVNITASLDFAMEEFESVGSVIEALVQNDATVVIGTVIDPDLEDEVRVTVIVTGLSDTQNPFKRSRNLKAHAISTPPPSHTASDDIQRVSLVAPENTTDDELAELLMHLSNVYKSIGGDELIIETITDLPPGSNSKAPKVSHLNRGARR